MLLPFLRVSNGDRTVKMEHLFRSYETVLGRQNGGSLERILVIFQDRPMFSRIIQTVSTVKTNSWLRSHTCIGYEGGTGEERNMVIFEGRLINYHIYEKVSSRVLY